MLFRVIIIRANAQAVNAFLDYQSAVSFPGFQALPAGAINGDEIDVPVQ